MHGEVPVAHELARKHGRGECGWAKPATWKAALLRPVIHMGEQFGFGAAGKLDGIFAPSRFGHADGEQESAANSGVTTLASPLV